MEYVKSNKGGFKLLHDNYMYVKQKVFKNHQPTSGCTGNHCIISKLCTWETMKILKKWNTKILLWGVLSGGFCLGGFCLGDFCRGVYVRGVFVLEPSLLPHFVWKSQTIEGTFLPFPFIREWMNMNECMTELWWIWRTSESHNSLSSWYILEISFVTE